MKCPDPGCRNPILCLEPDEATGQRWCYNHHPDKTKDRSLAAILTNRTKGRLKESREERQQRLLARRIARGKAGAP